MKMIHLTIGLLFNTRNFDWEIFTRISLYCRSHTCTSLMSCVESSSSPCNPIVRALYEGMNATYRYICDEASEGKLPFINRH